MLIYNIYMLLSVINEYVINKKYSDFLIRIYLFFGLMFCGGFWIC